MRPRQIDAPVYPTTLEACPTHPTFPTLATLIYSPLANHPLQRISREFREASTETLSNMGRFTRQAPALLHHTLKAATIVEARLQTPFHIANIRPKKAIGTDPHRLWKLHFQCGSACLVHSEFMKMYIYHATAEWQLFLGNCDQFSPFVFTPCRPTRLI